MKKTALILALMSLVLLGGTAIAAIVDQTAQPPPYPATLSVLPSNPTGLVQATKGMYHLPFPLVVSDDPIATTISGVTLLPFGDPTLFEAGRADILEVNLTSATIADMSPREVRATMSSEVASGMIGTRPMELTLAMSRGPTG